MADKKISALTAAATPLAGTEVLPIVQSGSTVKVSIADVTAGRAVAASAVVVGAGTVSAPSVTFAGDTNTGLYSPAADTIAFVEGGVEAMRIDSSGNVGVGVSSPESGFRLHVVGNAFVQNTSGQTTGKVVVDSADNRLVLGSYFEAGVGQHSFISSTNNAETGNIPLLFRTGTAERMRIESSGEVYIAGTTDQGAYNLQVNGTGVWGAGAYVNGSDRNLKEDIAPLADALSVVTALNPVTFRYKEEYSKDQSVQPGFIAQELQEALADQVYVGGVVHAGPEHLNVAYQALVPILVKAIQELTARVTELEGK